MVIGSKILSMSTPAKSQVDSSGNPRIQTYERYSRMFFQLIDRKQEIKQRNDLSDLDDISEYNRIISQLDELRFRMDAIVENIIHNNEEMEFYRGVSFNDEVAIE